MSSGIGWPPMPASSHPLGRRAFEAGTGSAHLWKRASSRGARGKEGFDEPTLRREAHFGGGVEALAFVLHRPLGVGHRGVGCGSLGAAARGGGVAGSAHRRHAAAAAGLCAQAAEADGLIRSQHLARQEPAWGSPGRAFRRRRWVGRPDGAIAASAHWAGCVPHALQRGVDRRCVCPRWRRTPRPAAGVNTASSAISSMHRVHAPTARTGMAGGTFPQQSRMWQAMRHSLTRS